MPFRRVKGPNWLMGVFMIRPRLSESISICLVYPAPFAVFLNQDNRNYVEPDISVICDQSRLDDRGCNGAPDWIIEIISPSTQQMDYGIKLFKYRTAGVREYWIINPITRTVNVYDFQYEKNTCQYSFNDDISVCIFPELTIQPASLLSWCGWVQSPLLEE